MSRALYNPNRKPGEAFNQDRFAPTDFHEISQEDRDEQARRLERLKSDTYEKLYPVSEIERLEN